jgi:hypothetical protein
MKLALLFAALCVASATGRTHLPPSYLDYDQTLPHCNSKAGGFLGRLSKINAACSCNDGERKVTNGRTSFRMNHHHYPAVNLGYYYVCRTAKEAMDVIINDYALTAEEGEILAKFLIKTRSFYMGSKAHMHPRFKDRRLTRMHGHRRLYDVLYDDLQGTKEPNPEAVKSCMKEVKRNKPKRTTEEYYDFVKVYVKCMEKLDYYRSWRGIWYPSQEAKDEADRRYALAHPRYPVYKDYDQTLPHCNSKKFYGYTSKLNAACSCNDGENKMNGLEFNIGMNSRDGYFIQSSLYVCRTATGMVNGLIHDYDLTERQRLTLAVHLLDRLGHRKLMGPQDAAGYALDEDEDSEVEESDWEAPVRRLRLRRPTPSRAGWGYGKDFNGQCRSDGITKKYTKGVTCDRLAGKYSFYGCSDRTCQWCTKNTWTLSKLSAETRSKIKC